MLHLLSESPECLPVLLTISSLAQLEKEGQQRHWCRSAGEAGGEGRPLFAAAGGEPEDELGSDPSMNVDGP